jgi:hypothetical protein
MLIFDESLVSVSSLLLNTPVVNIFILFYELSKKLKKNDNEIIYVKTDHSAGVLLMWIY